MAGKAAPAPTLDLSCLLMIDQAGIAAIHRLQEAGTLIRGASPYIHLLLEEVPPDLNREKSAPKK